MGTPTLAVAASSAYTISTTGATTFTESIVVGAGHVRRIVESSPNGGAG